MQASRIRRIFYWGGLVVLIGAAFVLIQVVFSSVPFDSDELPNPNGYDRFLEAANALKSDPPAELSGDDPQTREFVAANREALNVARSGLAMACQVTINYQTNVAAYSEAHMPELASLKRLGRTLAAEGLVARSEGRKSDAMQSFQDCMRFGQACSWGGVMIDGLVGMAIERVGINHARQLLPELDGKDCKGLTKKLEALRRTRASAEEFLANEKVWVSRMFGLRERFMAWLRPGLLKPARDNFISKVHGNEQVADLFLIESAIRAYAFDKNEMPAQLGDLVPGYLEMLPKDPVSKTDFLYDRATGTVQLIEDRRTPRP